jgi:hypothetical protein
MELPGNFKRNYKFRSDKKKDRLSYIIALVLSAIAFAILWYFL